MEYGSEAMVRDRRRPDGQPTLLALVGTGVLVTTAVVVPRVVSGWWVWHVAIAAVVALAVWTLGRPTDQRPDDRATSSSPWWSPLRWMMDVLVGTAVLRGLWLALPDGGPLITTRIGTFATADTAWGNLALSLVVYAACIYALWLFALGLRVLMLTVLSAAVTVGSILDRATAS